MRRRPARIVKIPAILGFNQAKQGHFSGKLRVSTAASRSRWSLGTRRVSDPPWRGEERVGGGTQPLVSSGYPLWRGLSAAELRLWRGLPTTPPCFLTPAYGVEPPPPPAPPADDIGNRGDGIEALNLRPTASTYSLDQPSTTMSVACTGGSAPSRFRLTMPC